MEPQTMIVTLQSRNTVTIPRELRQALELKAGDPLELRLDAGRLVLTPVAVVPRSLRLTDKGRAKEAEADLRAGRVSRYIFLD